MVETSKSCDITPYAYNSITIYNYGYITTYTLRQPNMAMENPLLSLMIFLLKPEWVPKPWSSVAEGKDASCLPENPAYFGGKNGGTIVVTIGFNTKSWSNNLDVRYRDLHFGSFWSMAKGRGGKDFGNLEIRETSSNVHILKKTTVRRLLGGPLQKMSTSILPMFF